MAQQDKPRYTKQGGVATSEPSRLRRWLTSKVMTRLSSQRHQQDVRRKAERKRLKLGLDHQVEYFHQVDDAYSHLAVQLLQQLVEKYDVQLKCYLVSAQQGDNAPEPELLQQLSYYDAELVAPHYGLEFSKVNRMPMPELINKVQIILASLNNDQFIAHAHHISDAMWREDMSLSLIHI